MVARGEAEAYLRLPRDQVYREKIWDHAAGVLVVTEAGGTGDRHHRPRPGFQPGLPLEDNRGVVATNTPVHEMCSEAIKDLEIGLT